MKSVGGEQGYPWSLLHGALQGASLARCPLARRAATLPGVSVLLLSWWSWRLLPKEDLSWLKIIVAGERRELSAGSVCWYLLAQQPEAGRPTALPADSAELFGGETVVLRVVVLHFSRWNDKNKQYIAAPSRTDIAHYLPLSWGISLLLLSPTGHPHSPGPLGCSAVGFGAGWGRVLCDDADGSRATSVWLGED